MALALFVVTLLTVALAIGFGWGCAALARRWGVEPSSGFALGVVLGVFGVAVIGARARVRRREAALGEITW